MARATVPTNDVFRTYLKAGSKGESLHIDLESKLYLGGRNSSPEPPVLTRDFIQYDLHVISGDPKAGQAGNNALVEVVLGVQGSPLESADRDNGISLWLAKASRCNKPVWLMGNQPDTAVSFRNPESFNQRRLNGLDDPDFLFHGVAESNLDNSTWHCD